MSKHPGLPTPPQPRKSSRKPPSGSAGQGPYVRAIGLPFFRSPMVLEPRFATEDQRDGSCSQQAFDFLVKVFGVKRLCQVTRCADFAACEFIFLFLAAGE